MITFKKVALSFQCPRKFKQFYCFLIISSELSPSQIDSYATEIIKVINDKPRVAKIKKMRKAQKNEEDMFIMVIKMIRKEKNTKTQEIKQEFKVAIKEGFLTDLNKLNTLKKQFNKRLHSTVKDLTIKKRTTEIEMLMNRDFMFYQHQRLLTKLNIPGFKLSNNKKDLEFQMFILKLILENC